MTHSNETSSTVTKTITVARVGLGAGFVFFGLNGFLHFLPNPPVPPDAGSFLGALAATGYMFPLIKGTEVVAGALLVANRYVPLALALLAPVLVNIVAFHAFLAPAGLGLVVTLLALELVVAWAHRDAFRPMLAATRQSRTRAVPARVWQHAEASR